MSSSILSRRQAVAAIIATPIAALGLLTACDRDPNDGTVISVEPPAIEGICDPSSPMQVTVANFISLEEFKTVDVEFSQPTFSHGTRLQDLLTQEEYVSCLASERGVDYLDFGIDAAGVIAQGYTFIKVSAALENKGSEDAVISVSGPSVMAVGTDGSSVEPRSEIDIPYWVSGTEYQTDKSGSPEKHNRFDRKLLAHDPQPFIWIYVVATISLEENLAWVLDLSNAGNGSKAQHSYRINWS